MVLGKSQLSTGKKSPKKIRLWLSISQRQNYLDLQAVTGGISLDGTAFGIAFTQVATTRMACPDMKTEQLFLSALGKVTGFYMIDNFHAALYQQPQTPIIIIEKVQ